MELFGKYLKENKKINYALLVSLRKINTTIKNILSNFYRKKKIVIPLSKSTIIVETKDFKKAIKIAVSYFNIKNEQDLSWKKVFYSKPEKNSANDAFKFIYLKTEEDIYYFLNEDSDYTVNISSFINTFTNKEGKFLKINTKNKKIYSPKVINGILDKLEITISDNLRKEIIENKPKVIKIGSWVPNPQIDGKLKITFNALMTRAFLTIQPPKTWGKPIETDEVIKELRRLKIKAPYSKKNIENNIRQKKYHIPILIVQSKEPTEYKKGFYEEVYKKKNSSPSSKFMHEIHLVNKDQLLVISHKSKRGEDGENLFGEKIEAEQLKEEHIFKPGKNIYIKENKLFAKIDGCIYRVDKDKWVVEEVLMLDEITNKTSKIEHNGTIIVKESISDATWVYAEKDIIVGKSISNSRIKCKNNIIVQLGIVGQRNHLIQVEEGNLKAKFIQGISLIVKKDIIVDAIINNCDVICGNSITSTDNKGSIWGGEVKVTNLIDVSNLGSKGTIETKVVMSIPYDFMISMREITLAITEKKDKITNLKNERSKHTILNKMEKAQEIYQEMKNLNREVLDLQKQLDKIQKDLYGNHPNLGMIKIKRNFYSNVTISFLNSEYKNLFAKKKIDIFVSEKTKKIVFKK